MNQQAIIEAFQLAGITGHVKYDPYERMLVVKKTNFTIDPSRFETIINSFFDEHKKEIMQKEVA